MPAQIDKFYISSRPWKVWSRFISYLFFEGRPLTTRGQWINPFLFVLFSALKRIHPFKKANKPVYILGTGRSGTTILGIVLSMHRDVGFLNEPKALWHSIYENEDLIGSYSRKTATYRISPENVTADVVKHAQRLYGHYLFFSGSRRIVDKYPELIFRIPFIKELFPNAKFIFLTRNGWDTCHSIEAWSERLGYIRSNEVHDWWGANRRKWNLMLEQIIPEHDDLSPHIPDMRNWTKHSDMAALEWIVTMREGLRIAQLYPNDVKMIHYEDLCMKPTDTLLHLANFCDLDANDKAFLNYGQSVLKPTEPKTSFTLHVSIEKPFRDLMKLLGY